MSQPSISTLLANAAKDMDTIADLRQQLATVTKERDQARAELLDNGNRFADELMAMMRQRDEAREALRAYGVVTKEQENQR